MCHIAKTVIYARSSITKVKKVAQAAFLWFAFAVSVAITGISVPERCVGAEKVQAAIYTCTVKCNAKKPLTSETRMYWVCT